MAVLSARITGSANLAVMKPESRNTFGLADNSLTGTQKALLDKALEIVRDHMSDPDFSNEVFIKEMGMCKTVLYEKLRTLTGQTISEFITCVRLKQAMDLLLHRTSSISAIAYDTGFKSPSLFSRSFKRYFGVTPTEFAKRETAGEDGLARLPDQTNKTSKCYGNRL